MSIPIPMYFYGIHVVFLSKYLLNEFDTQVNTNTVYLQYSFERLWVKIQDKTLKIMLR